MNIMLAWISAALFVLVLLLGLVALFLMRRLKRIILEFYRRMEAMTGEVAMVRHEVADASHRLRADIASLTGDVAAFRPDIASLTGDVAAFRPDIASLTGDVAAFRPGIADANRQLAAAERRLADVNHQLADANHHLGEVTAALPRIAEGVARGYAPARVANVLANEHVLDHLAALRAEAVPPGGVSYAFRRAIDALTPTVMRRGDERTVICSVALGETYFAKVVPALTSQQYFAESQGLSYAVLTDPPSYSERPPAWMKIPLILALFEQGFERVVYIDADALVTRSDFDIDAVFGAPNPNGSLRLTEDEAGINCGVMFLQDGPAIRRLLDLVWLFDAEVTHGTWEQYALKCLMDHSPAVARHVTIEADPRRFNSFPIERNRFYPTMEKSVWRPGDFICHISGIRSPHLETLIERYATRIAPLPYYGRAS